MAGDDERPNSQHITEAKPSAAAAPPVPGDIEIDYDGYFEDVGAWPGSRAQPCH